MLCTQRGENAELTCCDFETPEGGGRAAALEFSLHFSLARTRARQEVFVFSLHLFTGMPQMVVAQRVRGEGFLFLGSRW